MMNKEDFVLLHIPELSIEEYGKLLRYLQQEFPKAEVMDLNNFRTLEEELKEVN